MNQRTSALNFSPAADIGAREEKLVELLAQRSPVFLEMRMDVGNREQIPSAVKTLAQSVSFFSTQEYLALRGHIVNAGKQSGEVPKVSIVHGSSIIPILQFDLGASTEAGAECYRSTLSFSKGSGLRKEGREVCMQSADPYFIVVCASHRTSREFHKDGIFRGEIGRYDDHSRLVLELRMNGEDVRSSLDIIARTRTPVAVIGKTYAGLTEELMLNHRRKSALASAHDASLMHPHPPAWRHLFINIGNVGQFANAANELLRTPVFAAKEDTKELPATQIAVADPHEKQLELF